MGENMAMLVLEGHRWDPQAQRLDKREARSSSQLAVRVQCLFSSRHALSYITERSVCMDVCTVSGQEECMSDEYDERLRSNREER